MSQTVFIVMYNSLQTGKQIEAVYASKGRATDKAKFISNKWGVESWVVTWDVE